MSRSGKDKATVVALVIHAAGMSAARGAESIVGTWAPDPANCTPVGGMVSIGALSLTADETSCTFKDVSRSGNVVTWHGRCSDGEVSKPSTVVATLRAGRLTITTNGNHDMPLRRCRPE